MWESWGSQTTHKKNNINDNPSPGMVLVLQLDGKGLQELVQIAVGIPQIVLVTSAFRWPSSCHCCQQWRWPKLSFHGSCKASMTKQWSINIRWKSGYRVKVGCQGCYVLTLVVTTLDEAPKCHDILNATAVARASTYTQNCPLVDMTCSLCGIEGHMEDHRVSEHNRWTSETLWNMHVLIHTWIPTLIAQ